MEERRNSASHAELKAEQPEQPLKPPRSRELNAQPTKGGRNGSEGEEKPGRREGGFLQPQMQLLPPQQQ
jgi:hypothetical protein